MYGFVFMSYDGMGKQRRMPYRTTNLKKHHGGNCFASGQADVLTCMVSSGRIEETDGERALGLFLNSVPFRMNLRGGSWADLILEAFESERAMFPFRRYPLAEVKKGTGSEPLFDTLFYYTNYYIYQGLQHWDATLLGSSFHEESSFPLAANFRLDPFTGRLHLDLQCDSSEFSSEQIASLCAESLANCAPDRRLRARVRPQSADHSPGSSHRSVPRRWY